MTQAIRDYLYLDVSRLRSLYSQLSGGIIEAIIQSRRTERATENRQSIEGSELARDMLLGNEKIETRVLHDYLFTEVEQLVSESIIVVDQSTLPLIGTGSIVRIKGKAEVDDSQRLLNVMEHFNVFQAQLQMMSNSNKLQDAIWDLKNKLESTVNKVDREKLERSLRELTPEGYIRTEKIGTPDIIFDALKMLFTLVYPDILEVKINPVNVNDIVFRAILDPQYLREDRTLIHAKYGSRTQAPWAIVGIVTSILDAQVVGNEVPSNTQTDGSALSVVTEPTSHLGTNMRDAIESVYSSIYEIEKLVLVSATRKTLIVTPLAVYHETQL